MRSPAIEVAVLGQYYAEHVHIDANAHLHTTSEARSPGSRIVLTPASSQTFFVSCRGAAKDQFLLQDHRFENRQGCGAKVCPYELVQDDAYR